MPPKADKGKGAKGKGDKVCLCVCVFVRACSFFVSTFMGSVLFATAVLQVSSLLPFFTHLINLPYLPLTINSLLRREQKVAGPRLQVQLHIK